MQYNTICEFCFNWIDHQRVNSQKISFDAETMLNNQKKMNCVFVNHDMNLLKLMSFDQFSII